MMKTLHIGHHFYGAGNLGDDLMLAGFLTALRECRAEVALTCCIPWDIAAMRRRFPEVQWLPYDAACRAESIARCDAWVGVGGTPFQSHVGPWLRDHLLAEAQACEAAAKPMFYVCVGVNDEGAAADPATAFLARRAAHVWTRDHASADVLAAHAPAAVTAGSDLAHIVLARRRAETAVPRLATLVLNFEEPGQYTLHALERLVAALHVQYDLSWMAQEVRSLEGSEVALHSRLAPWARAAAPLVVPDYAGAATVSGMLDSLAVPEVMFTSRYHATLLAAWSGSRVAVFPRCRKVWAAASELHLERTDDMKDVDSLIDAVGNARKAADATLASHALLAMRCCLEALDAIGVPHARPLSLDADYAARKPGTSSHRERS